MLPTQVFLTQAATGRTRLIKSNLLQKGELLVSGERRRCVRMLTHDVRGLWELEAYGESLGSVVLRPKVLLHFYRRFPTKRVSIFPTFDFPDFRVSRPSIFPTDKGMSGDSRSASSECCRRHHHRSLPTRACNFLHKLPKVT